MRHLEDALQVAVCRSVDDVEAALRGWCFTLRATTGRADLAALEDVA